MLHGLQSLMKDRDRVRYDIYTC